MILAAVAACAGGITLFIVLYFSAKLLYNLLYRHHDRSVHSHCSEQVVVGGTPNENQGSSCNVREKEKTTIDNGIYDRLAHLWWDEQSCFSAGLHAMTRLRAPFFVRCIRDHCRSWSERRVERAVSVVDVGCGGGILAEAIAREWERGQGGDLEIVGVDIAYGAVRVAQEHANGQQWRDGISLRYARGDATKLTETVPVESADVVVIADVLEHVDDLPTVIQHICAILRPGGLMLFDTVNRTVMSYIVAIVLAQELPVSLLPSHIHDWSLFVKPEELKRLCGRNGLAVMHVVGMRPEISWNTIRGVLMRSKLHEMEFTTTDDTSVQYIGWAMKQY